MAKNLLSGIMEKAREDRPSFSAKELINKIESGYLVGRDRKFTTKKSFSPSTIVYGKGKCPRFWYYAFEGAEWDDDTTPYSAANMKSGIHGHERLQEAMKKSGVMLEDEVKVICEDPPIYGFADGILDVEGEHLVCEIKTMRSESFEYRKQNNSAPSYHLEQLIIYMKVLKFAKGLLIYESKNSHELHVIEVEVDDKYINWVNYAFDWMRDVRASWEKKELPEKPYRSNSKVCKECPVKETCFADAKGDVKIPRLDPLET